MAGKRSIEIDIARQRLVLREGGEIVHEYPVSTGKNGPGEQMDSGCTPRGRHVIAEKYGAGGEVNAVFVAREATGEIYTPALRERHPDRDWILTRILRLDGCEDGFNRGGRVDSYDRYIYIHGSPDDVAMGKPGSAGCIRMRNADVIALFDAVDVGTEVLITD